MISREFWSQKISDDTKQTYVIAFKATHQERFTISTWQMFMESRAFSNDDVCFDEVRMWLCNKPLPGDAWDDREVVEMCEKLQKEKRKADYQSHKEFIALQVINDFL